MSSSPTGARPESSRALLRSSIIQRRRDTLANDTLPSTFPKNFLKNPFGLPLPLEVEAPPPVPRLSTIISPPKSPPTPTGSPSGLRPLVVHPPPKAPLAPQKLAAIANALGVHAYAPSKTSPSSKPPTAASPRFLLHVLPPMCLMPADEDEEEELQSPYSRSAPGYHGQFERGVMVPLHPTLASQLGAIAREYGLPSSGGLVLYLVSNGEAGPRISDEAWKTLWHKSLRHDRDNKSLLPSEKDSPQSSYPSPASSVTHGSTASALDIPIPSSLGLPIIAKVEFDIDRRKATWFDAFANARGLRGRPSTPASTRSDSAFPLPLRLRTRRSFDSRGRADTGSTLSRSQVSLSASDKAAADDEVRGVTGRAGIGRGIDSTSFRKGPPRPLKFSKGGNDRLSDSPVDLDEDEHLAYRIMIDGPEDGEDDEYTGPGSKFDRRASHLIMKEELDSLEKVMQQYSPKFAPGPGGSMRSSLSSAPSSASVIPPRTVSKLNAGRNGLPSPFGEPNSKPSPPDYNPGLSGNVPPGGARMPQSAGPTESSFQFPSGPPTLTINGEQRESAQPSGNPAYPPNSDAFSPKPSFGAAGEAMQNGASSVSPPARDASLPGSRFSHDSMKEGAANLNQNDQPPVRERTGSTAGVVKGFKRLWRKSSASGMKELTGGKGPNPGPPPPPMPMPPLSPLPSGGAGASMAAQQAAFMAQQSGTNRGSFSSQGIVPQQPMSATPMSPVPSLASDATSPKRSSDIDPFIFDQESTRYPSMSSNAPSTVTSNTNSSMNTKTNSPPTTYAPSVASVSTTGSGNNNSIGKKAGGGILKGWGVGRTRSPSVSTANSVPGVSTSTVPLPTDGYSPAGISPGGEDPRTPVTRARTPTTSRATGQALANFLAEEPSGDGHMSRPPTKTGNYI